MSSHPNFVTNLDIHDDLLSSYLNTEYLDTSITMDASHNAPSSFFNLNDAPFIPISSTHLLPPFPLSLAMNSLANQWMDTFGGLATTGVSPCSLSRSDDGSFPKLPPTSICVPPPISCTISPTLSIASTPSSSSDLEEPKRKRERKNHQGSKRHSTVPTTTLIACKPILPAGGGNVIKQEPVDTPSVDVHITVDHPPMDANSKRQERLIKNRAAALLSRKRKREHLQALEDERQWLTKENGILKSKTMALESKLHQLEKERQQQAQQLSLLEQQQRSLLSEDTYSDTHPTYYTISSSLESLSTMTNVLMILFVSFVLLSFPASSDNRLFTNGDSHGASITRSSSQSGANNGLSSMNLTLLSNQQQRRYFSSNTDDTSNKPLDLDQQHKAYYHGEHTLDNSKDDTW